MPTDVKATDLIIAFEPTGFFSPNASMVLGLLATAFISAMVLLFFYMFGKQIMPLRRRAAYFESWFDDWKEKQPTKDDIENVIPAEIEHMKWLADDWNAFKESIWERDGQLFRLEDEERQFKSFIPSAPGFSSSVPSMLTAIGILGTFIGITVGLGQIAVQMGGGSSDEMRGAMGALIQSLGVSFRTSIWGLILSMIGSSLQTRSMSDLKRQKRVWLQYIAKHFPLASLPRLAAEQLDALDAQRNMTMRHIRVTETSSDKMGQRIEKAINNMTETIGKSQSEGIGDLVSEFISQMNQSMGSDFGRLGESLDEMVATNRQFQDTMGDLIANLKGATANQGQSASQMQDAIQSAALAITEMKSSLSGLSGVTRSIQEAANAMQAALGAQVNAGSAQTETIENLLSGLKAQSQGWSSQQQAMDEAGESIRSQFQDLGKAIEDLVLWHNGVKDGLNKQIHAFNESLEAQRSVAADLATERRKATAIVAKLAETKQSLMPTAKEMTKASAAMQKASDGLYSSEKALIELTRQLKDASREWTDRQMQSIEDYSNISTGLNNILRKMGA